MYLKIFILVLCLSISRASYSQDNESKVILNNFEITGTTIYQGENRNVLGWLGLPYAEPPIKDLRWKAPRTFNGFSDNYNAINLPNRCVQVSNSYDQIIEDLDPGQIIGNEDCLYLNIYRPSNINLDKEKLPVMFWIHGGGNTWGYSASNMTTPRKFFDKHNVILITVNYRLGPFGWLA